VRCNPLAMTLQETTAMEPEKYRYCLSRGWDVDVKGDFESVDDFVNYAML
jgi:hypothetical protein